MLKKAKINILPVKNIFLYFGHYEYKTRTIWYDCRDSGSEEGELSSEDDAADGDMNNSNAKSFKPDLQTKNQGKG